MANPTEGALDRLSVPAERTYPLEEVPAAFGASAGGTLGKIAISVAGPLLADPAYHLTSVLWSPHR